MSVAKDLQADQAYLTEMDADTGFVDLSANRKKGVELHERYQNAKPFPHIVLDNFLPHQILDRCLREFPSDIGSLGTTFDSDHERYKRSFNPDELNPWLRTLFYSFNSLPFIQVLQNITGIKSLVPDPYFLGAGFHEIGRGGHLSVHADFNHHKPMNLERRINVLIYLNKDWDESYGGSLELWDLAMKNCEVKVTPEFNRCVIFNTSSNSWHGNPDPISHPGNATRKSIALYYYTSTWQGTKRSHTTQFQARPDSEDKGNLGGKLREFVIDCTPPILMRQVRKARSRTE